MPSPKPWHDHPPCPKCKEGPTCFLDGRPKFLLCLGCNHTWAGNAAELARTRKAEKAWARESKRQEKAAALKERTERERAAYEKAMRDGV